MLLLTVFGCPYKTPRDIRHDSPILVLSFIWSFRMKTTGNTARARSVNDEYATHCQYSTILGNILIDLLTSLEITKAQLDNRVPTFALGVIPQGRDRSTLCEGDDDTKQIDKE